MGKNRVDMPFFRLKEFSVAQLRQGDQLSVKTEEPGKAREF